MNVALIPHFDAECIPRFGAIADMAADDLPAEGLGRLRVGLKKNCRASTTSSRRRANSTMNGFMPAVYPMTTTTMCRAD